jgi:hypothetical protein
LAELNDERIQHERNQPAQQEQQNQIGVAAEQLPQHLREKQRGDADEQDE